MKLNLSNCSTVLKGNSFLTYLFCFFVLSCQTKNDKREKEKLVLTDTITPEFRIEDKKLDTLLNTKDYLVLGGKPAKVKVINENEVDKFKTFEILIRYHNDVIVGKNIKYDNVAIYRKYIPKTSFKDYPVEIYNGELAEPDFSTNPEAKRFTTRIKQQCDKGINFAGHYTLVTWGCGSSCQSGVVVDRKTGRIFWGYETSLGSKFKKNSKMIIRNVGAIDTITNLIRVCAYCEVNHKIWTGAEFKEIE